MGPVFSHEDVVVQVQTEARSRAAAGDVLPGRALARWLIVLGTAAAALILGYVGLDGYLSHQTVPGFGRGWADVLFYDVQLFVFNSAPTQGAGPFPVELGIARFLAPATTVVAAVEAVRLLLREQLRRWCSAIASNHAIVTGDSPAAIELAAKLRTEYRKVVLVGISPATAEQARRQRLLDVPGDPTEPSTLRAAGLGRADALYACADLSTTNAATALRAREISQAHGHTLITYAQVRDAEICTALRARRIGAIGDLRFRLEFFSVEDTAARVLLDKYPLAQKDEPPAQVVVIGFGRLGRAVLREIARRPVPGGSPVTVRIHGESSEIVSAYLGRFPAIGRNCSVSCDGDPQQSAGDAPALTFICLPSNDDALTAGLAAAHSLTARSDRVVICMSEPSPFGAVLTGASALLDDVQGRLTVFEVIEEACVPGRIRLDLADQLARAIHQAYVDNCAARGDSPQLNQSMRPWEELPEDLRHANLAQAAHIGTKLDAIDCAVAPESATTPEFAFSDGEIERLAQMEHHRWVQEREAQGFVPGPNREARQHPDLVDWQYLSENAKEKDRDAIRELPAILRRAGFQILRLPPRPA
jgi:hypothetical protein